MSARWKVNAASVTGRAHARGAMPNQDTFAVAPVGEALVVAVADGASDAGEPCVASAAAVAVAISVLTRQLRRGVPGDTAGWRSLARRAAVGIVHRYTLKVGWFPLGTRQRFATTLTAVAVAPPWCAAVVIGDGFAVTRSGVDGFGLFAPPSPDSIFLPLATSARARLFAARVDDLTGVAVSSDGMDTLLLEYEQATPKRPVAQAWRQLFEVADDAGADDMRLTRILASESVCRLTEDDKTLVLAVPR